MSGSCASLSATSSWTKPTPPGSPSSALVCAQWYCIALSIILRSVRTGISLRRRRIELGDSYCQINAPFAPWRYLLTLCQENFSFIGACRPLSKVVVIFVMVRPRSRLAECGLHISGSRSASRASHGGRSLQYVQPSHSDYSDTDPCAVLLPEEFSTNVQRAKTGVPVTRAYTLP